MSRNVLRDSPSRSFLRKPDRNRAVSAASCRNATAWPKRPADSPMATSAKSIEAPTTRTGQCLGGSSVTLSEPGVIRRCDHQAPVHGRLNALLASRIADRNRKASRDRCLSLPPGLKRIRRRAPEGREDTRRIEERIRGERNAAHGRHNCGAPGTDRRRARMGGHTAHDDCRSHEF